jgi:type IV secretion system protein VirB6
MFSYVGNLIDSMLATYLTDTLSSVVAVLIPIVIAAQTLWMLLYAYDVVRGQVQEPVMTFLWQSIKIAFICGVALVSSMYQTFVQDVANGLTTGLVASFIPAGSAVNTTNIWTILDGFNTAASDLVLKAVDADDGVAFPDLMPYFAAALFSIGNCVMLVVAFCITLWVRVIQTFVFAVGPIFVLMLAFKPTARFFDGWLGMLFSSVVLTWLVFFVLGFSIGTGQGFIEKIQLNFDTINLLAEALTYVVIMIVFAFIIYQAPSVSSSLTGGGPSQYGAGLVQQALHTYRWVQKLIKGGNGPGDGQVHRQGQGQGGTVHRGSGASYGAGAAVSQVASTMRTVATRAYQRAALRGRK